MFLEFFKFSTNQRLTLLIMCSLGFAKGFFPLRFPRKSPRPPCFWRPFGACYCGGICRAICAARRGFALLQAGQIVSILPLLGEGVFWLRAGQIVSLFSPRGAGSFLVRAGLIVSLFSPRGLGAAKRPPSRRDGRWWAIAGV